MGTERQPASRVQGVAPSATLAASRRVREMREKGIDIIDLGVGEPDFPTPAHIVAEAKAALDAGATHYAPPTGLPVLRQAIVEHAAESYGLNYDPVRDVIVTPGAKQALFEIFLAMVDPGDEVLVPEPAWVSYREAIRMAGGLPVPVPLDPSDGYRLAAERLEAAVGPRTAGIVFSSPSNPTGRVLSMSELHDVALVAARHDLFVVSDQIYEDIRYDGRALATVASLEGMAGRTFIVNGFSKAYAMTGWRLGYLLGPSRWVEAVLKVHEHSVTTAATFTMQAAATALRGPRGPLTAMVEAFRHRRDMVVDALSTVPGVRLTPIEGAFYAFPDVGCCGLDSRALAARLLDEAHVSVTPGIAFGSSADSHIRLSFATDNTSLEAGLSRIASFLRS